MNHKGYALIEFVIILPILLFFFLVGYDFFHMYETKVCLEKELSEVLKEYTEEKSFDELNQMIKTKNANAKLEIKNENNEYLTIYLKEEINLHAPGLNRILKTPYEIVAETTIPKEKTKEELS